MLNVLSSVFKFVTRSDVQETLLNAIFSAQRSRLDAETETAKAEIDARIVYLQTQHSLLLAEQNHWSTRMIRPLFAAPFILFNAKVIIWDSVFGLGVTNALSPELIQLEMIVFGAYFVMRPFEKRKRMGAPP